MAATSDSTGKLRLVLDYLPCEACLHMDTPEQELFCSLCTRLQRTVVQKSTVLRDVVVETPVAVSPEIVEVPPAVAYIEPEPEVEPESEYEEPRAPELTILRADAPDTLDTVAEVIANGEDVESGDVGVVVGGLEDAFPTDEIEEVPLPASLDDVDWDVQDAEGDGKPFIVAGEFDHDHGFAVAGEVASKRRPESAEARVKPVEDDDETSFVITPYADEPRDADLVAEETAWPEDTDVIAPAENEPWPDEVRQGSDTASAAETPWPEDDGVMDYEVIEVIHGEDAAEAAPAEEAPVHEDDAYAEPYAPETVRDDSVGYEPVETVNDDLEAPESFEEDGDEPAYEAPVVEDLSETGPKQEAGSRGPVVDIDWGDADAHEGEGIAAAEPELEPPVDASNEVVEEAAEEPVIIPDEPDSEAAVEPEGGLLARMKRRREIMEAEIDEELADESDLAPAAPPAEPAEREVEEVPRFESARNVPLTQFEGVGPMYASRLAGADVATSSDLVGQDAWDLASRTGIAAKLLERWVTTAELIEAGVPPKAADAVVKAGVRSAADLKSRDAADLARRVSEYDSDVTEAHVKAFQNLV